MGVKTMVCNEYLVALEHLQPHRGSHVFMIRQADKRKNVQQERQADKMYIKTRNSGSPGTEVNVERTRYRIRNPAWGSFRLLSGRPVLHAVKLGFAVLDAARPFSA